MANFQKKYYFNFNDIQNNVYSVEIWQDTLNAITPSEIRADASPFTVEYPLIENKFTPIHSSGCTINLLSQSDRQFLNLYTSKIQEYQIRAFKNSNPIFLGYLNSELYSEDFSQLDNYPVTITGNDGFSLLERLTFLDASKNKYSGVSTGWTILTNILSKISLPFNYIYVGLSTSSSDFSISANETLLHKISVIQDNFYNEDGEAETCKKVLSSLFIPFGAFIIQCNGNLYITDVNYLANGNSQNFKKYNGTTYSYISTDSIDLNLGDLTTIKFSSSNQNFDVINGYNKQVVSYSPYPNNKIIDYSAENDFSTSGTVTNFGTAPYNWSETEFSNSLVWTGSGNGKFIKQIAVTNQGQTNEKTETDFYLKINPYVTEGQHINLSNKSFTYKGVLPYMIPTTEYKMKINFSAYFRKFADYENPSNVPDSLIYARIFCKLSINGANLVNHSTLGADYIVTSYPSFWGSLSSSYLAFDLFEPITLNEGNTFQTFDNLEDKWINLQSWSVNTQTKSIVSKDYTVPLFGNPIGAPVNFTGLSGGVMTFEIYGFSCYGRGAGGTLINSQIKDCRIKDLTFSLVDKSGNEISSSDLEYIGYMDNSFKNEGSKIQTILGTNTRKSPCERGSLLWNNSGIYNYCTTFTREGTTDNIENLLLRSVVSNYQTPTVQLQATTNQINSPFGILTYNNWLSGKKFMLSSIRQNYEGLETELTLQEIQKDNLTVNHTSS